MSPEKRALLAALDEDAGQPDEERLAVPARKGGPKAGPRRPPVTKVWPGLTKAAHEGGVSIDAVVDAALGVSDAAAQKALEASVAANEAASKAESDAVEAERRARELRAAAGVAHTHAHELASTATNIQEGAAAGAAAAAKLSEAELARVRTLAGTWPGTARA